VCSEKGSTPGNCAFNGRAQFSRRRPVAGRGDDIAIRTIMTTSFPPSPMPKKKTSEGRHCHTHPRTSEAEAGEARPLAPQAQGGPRNACQETELQRVRGCG